MLIFLLQFFLKFLRNSMEPESLHFRVRAMVRACCNLHIATTVTYGCFLVWLFANKHIKYDVDIVMVSLGAVVPTSLLLLSAFLRRDRAVESVSSYTAAKHTHTHDIHIAIHIYTSTNMIDYYCCCRCDRET